MIPHASTYEEVTFARDCNAILVPDGTPMVVPEGTMGVMMQVLGRNMTLRVATGHMIRVAGVDADALGKDPNDFAAQQVDLGGGLITETIVWKSLEGIFDPEIPVNIVELGLIYGVELNRIENPLDGEGIRASVRMTLTAPGCGMGQVLVNDVESTVMGLPGVANVDVDLVFEPMWTPAMMSEEAQLELGFG